MDHAEAVNSLAVERYLLGQMSDSETESFEMHFFECTVCTEEIESGTLLAENIRSVFTDEVPKRNPAARPVAEPGSDKWAWLMGWWKRPQFAVPAMAAAALAVITIYQSGFVVPALQRQIAEAGRPQALLAFAIRSASRGEENRIQVPAGMRFIAIQVDLVDTSFPLYRCELSDASGADLFSVDSLPPPPGSPLGILIPIHGLHSGAYTLKVRGVRDSAAKPEVAHYSFLLQLE